MVRKSRTKTASNDLKKVVYVLQSKFEEFVKILKIFTKEYLSLCGALTLLKVSLKRLKNLSRKCKFFFFNTYASLTTRIYII